MVQHIVELEEDLTPSPSRLVESLRDTGYSYQAAFADVIDNSVAAGATVVRVDLYENFIGTDLTVNFYDDGDGMDEAALVNAMRYGSEKRPSPKSLGKFGMGLKTASTAFCKKLTVISLKDGRIAGRCWDIDRIKEADRWVLIKPDLNEYADQVDVLKSIAKAGSGTVVIWEKVDRLVSASGTDFAKQALEHVVHEIREHLSATFGKFLIGCIDGQEGSGSALQVQINGERLEGWDPTGVFLNTPENPDRVIRQYTQHNVTLSTGAGTRDARFELNGFVLPNKSDMSLAELAQTRFSNDNQGFYIYRENRLIYGGGWPHRLFSQDSHLNLLRVELKFDHYLDEYFEIDIRKSKINLPIKIREQLKKILAPWRNEAQRRYRRGAPAVIDEPGSNEVAEVDHNGSSRAIQRQTGQTDRVQVVNFDRESRTIKIKNRFGVVEINRAAIVEGTNVFVTTVSTLDGGMLWSFEVTDLGDPIVILNESHAFYERFYRSEGINPVLVQAMDSMFWALANSELNSLSELSKRNFEELRVSLSNSLSCLARELPNVE